MRLLGGGPSQGWAGDAGVALCGEGAVIASYRGDVVAELEQISCMPTVFIRLNVGSSHGRRCREDGPRCGSMLTRCDLPAAGAAPRRIRAHTLHWG